MIAWDVVSAMKASVHVKMATKVMIAVARFQHPHQVLYHLLLQHLLHHRVILVTPWHSFPTTCHLFVQKNATRMENAMKMVRAHASQGIVEQLARIFARFGAAVKESASMGLACAWLEKLVLIVVFPFAAPVTVTATSQMCASVIKVGAVEIVVSQCHVLTQIAQVMVNVTLASANVTLDGKGRSANQNL